MSGQPLLKRTDDPIVAKAKAERRRFRRVDVNLPGKLFLPVESREIACKVVDLSTGGASIECEFLPEIGTPVVLYVEGGFGRFEGTVARRDGYGFGMRFNATATKREKIAEQLTLFMNKMMLDSSVMRREERLPSKALAQFTRADGTVIKCEVVDLSTGGVSLKTLLRPQVGEYVLIGKLAARVARHHPDGIGLEFVGLRPDQHTPDTLHADISIPR